MDSMDTTTAAGTASTDPRPSVWPKWRWRIGGAILMLWIVGQTVLWIRAGDRTHQVVSVLQFSIPMTLIALLWWTLCPGQPWRSRLLGLLAGAAAVGLFLTAFRFEEFGGDMSPIFAPRFGLQADDDSETQWDNTSTISFTVPGDPSAAPVLRDMFDDGGESPVADDDWPRFRGPVNNGKAHAQSIQRDWSANPPRELWRHPVGAAWSSFAIVGERAYTQEQRDELECVVCYHALTGQQAWVHTDASRYATTMGGTGPRATPTIDGERLYALGANGKLDCLNRFSGESIWSTDILADAEANNIDWAMSASPLIHGDTVIVNPGGHNGRGVIAYDKRSGDIVWAAGDHPASYCAPQIVELHGRPSLIILDGDGLAGMDPDSGVEWWRYEWSNTYRINVAAPIVTNNRLFISSGYGTGCVLLAPPEPGSGSAVREVWPPNKVMKLKFNDAILIDGYVYGLDEGILCCVDIETGQRQWKSKRYRYGQVLWIDDHLLVQAESGEVVLLTVSPEQATEVGRLAALDAKTWNHPVVHRGHLYVRNHKEAACFDISKP